MDHLKGQINNRYSKMSQAPFTILVESKSAQLCNLHVMAIARKLHEAGIDHTEAVRRGPNRLQLTFDNLDSAKSVVNGVKKLPDDWYSYIPDEKIFSIGVVQNIDLDLDISIITSQINSSYPNSKAERFHKKVDETGNGSIQLVPTDSIKIYFSTGNLPDNVIINKFRCDVKPYIQNVLQCTRCWRFGHPAMYCRSKNPYCVQCSDTHVFEGSCKNTSTKCINCKGKHYANDRSCPKYLDLKNKKKSLAVSKTAPKSHHSSMRVTTSNTRAHSFSDSLRRNLDQGVFQTKNKLQKQLLFLAVTAAPKI